MGIVINEFEAVAQAPTPASQRETPVGNDGETPAPPDPAQLAAALCVLAEQAARIWAH